MAGRSPSNSVCRSTQWPYEEPAELGSSYLLKVGEASIFLPKVERETYDQIKDYALIHNKIIQQIVNRGLTWWLETEAEATTEDKFEKMATARSLPEWRSQYVHLTMRRGRKIAKVAMARKLAVRLYWMMRKEWDFGKLTKFGSHAGQPGNRHGVK